jgi:hypothetical protein
MRPIHVQEPAVAVGVAAEDAEGVMLPALNEGIECFVGHYYDH